MDSIFIPVLVFISLLNTIVLVGLAGIVKEMADAEQDETSFTPLVKKEKRRARSKSQRRQPAVDPMMLD